jgi:hypothetical protein
MQITSPKKDPEAQPAADREAREKAQAVTTRMGGFCFRACSLENSAVRWLAPFSQPQQMERDK